MKDEVGRTERKADRGLARPAGPSVRFGLAPGASLRRSCFMISLQHTPEANRRTPIVNGQPSKSPRAADAEIAHMAERLSDIAEEATTRHGRHSPGPTGCHHPTRRSWNASRRTSRREGIAIRLRDGQLIACRAGLNCQEEFCPLSSLFKSISPIRRFFASLPHCGD